MKPEELIRMCDAKIERYAADGCPILPGDPRISFLWPTDSLLPGDFFGLEHHCGVVKYGTVICIPAKSLKQKLEYALMEGFGVSIGER